MMLNVDARGDACPLPVVKAKKAIAALNGAGEVEVLVDNEIAVQNLTKMAQQKGYGSSAEKLAELSTASGSRWAMPPLRPKSLPSAHPMPAPIPWWPSQRIRWARGPRSWARPCSRRSSSR